MTKAHEEAFGKYKGPKLSISFTLDCCGANGQHHLFCEAIAKGEIENGLCLDLVRFKVPCEHDEYSFANLKGGEYTQKRLDVVEN